MSDVATWIVATADVAAFTSGPDGTVVGWNDAAEGLLGPRARDVLGTPCHEVMCGRDPYGNVYCGPCCPIRGMACRDDTIRRFRLDVGELCAVPMPLWVSVVVIGGRRAAAPTLVHLLEPVIPLACDLPGMAEGTDNDASQAGRTGLLTPEEASLLELLNSRVSIDVVAAVLGVDALRARSVLLGCLRKLETIASPGEACLAARLSPSPRKLVT